MGKAISSNTGEKTRFRNVKSKAEFTARLNSD